MYLVMFLAFINVVLTVLTKLGSSNHDMHHIFDNVSGHILIGYRIIIFLIFIYAITNTYKVSRSRVKSFIIYFGILGGIYICAMPLIVWMGNVLIAPKNRHEFVFIMVEGVKCLTNIGMSYMLNE